VLGSSIFSPAPVSSNPAALSKPLLLLLQTHLPQSNFTVHLPAELLIPTSASHSTCPPSAQTTHEDGGKGSKSNPALLKAPLSCFETSAAWVPSFISHFSFHIFQTICLL